MAPATPSKAAEGAPNNSPATPAALASGPQFHVGEKVLCTDKSRHPEKPKGRGKKKKLPPLYEAVVRQSGLKRLDADGDILEEKKKRGGRRKSPPPETAGVEEEGSGEGEKQWCHLVHFQGWNSRWDRWMTEAEMFRDTLENRQRVGIEEKEAKSEVKSPSKKGKEEKEKPKRGKKRKREKQASVEVEEEVDAGTAYERNLQLIANACELPFTLQTKLVDDRDKICNKIFPPPDFNAPDAKRHRGYTMLHVLPAGMTSVGDILGGYLRVKKMEDAEEKLDKAEIKLRKKRRKRFALSIFALFDLALPLYLLYPEERGQFREYMSETAGRRTDNSDAGKADGDAANANGEERPPEAPTRPSDVYGAYHLLRFLMKLPFLLSRYNPNHDAATYTRAEEEEGDAEAYVLASQEASKEFAEHISELVVFLQQNHGECFKGRYFLVV